MRFIMSIKNVMKFVCVLSCFCTVLGNMAHAATNPAGKTIDKNSGGPGMEATLHDPVLTNKGTIKINGIGYTFDDAYGMIANTSSPYITTKTNFTFLNNGTITLTNSTNPLLQARLIAMDATGGSANSAGHKLTNAGAINISNKVTRQQAFATGMNVNSDFLKGHTLINSGKMSLYVLGQYTSAYGMSASNEDDSNYKSGGHFVHNQAKGVITIEAHTTADSSQTVYGLNTVGTGVHSLINDGKITLTGISKGSSEVYGMSALAHTGFSTNASGTVKFNNGIDAVLNVSAQGSDGDNFAFGAYTDLAGSHMFTNKGSIVVTSKSTAKYNSTLASGFIVANTADATMTNSGTMKISAENNNDSTVIAAGLNVDDAGSKGHKLSNAGHLTISATGGGLAGEAYAYGMFVPFGNIANASNTGTISATSTGKNDIQSVGMMGSTLSNSGTINAKSTSSAGDAIAYGMYVTANGKVDNLGTINVSAQGKNLSAAYEVFGDTSYSVGSWAITLQDFSRYKVFGGAASVTVNFSDSMLILRPGTKAQGFAYGKEYAVKDMLNAAPALTGSIKSVKTDFPLLNATLTGSTIDNQKVSLTQNVTEDTNPGHNLSSQFLQLAESRMDNVSAQLGTRLRYAMLAISPEMQAGFPAGSLMESSEGHVKGTKWSVFLAPHGRLVNNSDTDINGGIGGFFGSLTHHFNDDFSLGLHMDFSSSSFNGEYMDMKSQSFAFSGGLHTSYIIMPQWYMRGSITASMDDNDVSLSAGTGSGLTADTSYASNAFFADLATGYVIKLNDKHSITPEIGLSWLNVYTQGYDLDWQGTLYDMQVEANNYNAFYGTAMLNYHGLFDLDEHGSIAINAGLGLRQNLSGFEVESKLRFGGDAFTTRSTEDPTSILATAGIEWKKDNFSIMLNYSGSYGQNQESHGGMLGFKYSF